MIKISWLLLRERKSANSRMWKRIVIAELSVTSERIYAMPIDN